MTETLTIHIPMTFRKRGGRKLMVAPDGTILTPAPARPEIDGAPLKAVARAFRWRKLLDAGVYGSIKEIATKEKIDSSYVGDVLRLTLLAPDIIEAILDGRQPPTPSVRGAAQVVPARVGGSAQGDSPRRVNTTCRCTWRVAPLRHWTGAVSPLHENARLLAFADSRSR